jgi:hypothetical protein
MILSKKEEEVRMMDNEIKRLTSILKHPSTNENEVLNTVIDDTDAYKHTESDN